MVTFDTHEALFGCNHLGCITMMSVASCIPFPFSAPCNAMLTMLLCATHWLSVHLYMLTYVSMHESCLLVCPPRFQTMELWHLIQTYICPSQTPPFICFLASLPSCLFACFPVSLLAMSIMLICFMPLSYALCMLASCLCLCMYTHVARMHGVRAQSPRRKQKGQRHKHVDISQVALFSSFRGLASPICLCTLLNHLPSSLLSLLDVLY